MVSGTIDRPKIEVDDEPAGFDDRDEDDGDRVYPDDDLPDLWDEEVEAEEVFGINYGNEMLPKD